MILSKYLKFSFKSKVLTGVVKVNCLIIKSLRCTFESLNTLIGNLNFSVNQLNIKPLLTDLKRNKNTRSTLQK